MKVIVVGAGIIGALSAYRLAEAGAEVTVVEAGTPAGAASGASFGWINASFYANRDHFNLRAEAMLAHRRLSEKLGSRAAQWTGCLCWEEQGAEFDRQHRDLSALGYDVREVDRRKFASLEPAIDPPERALQFVQEGAVDLPVLARDALSAACTMGARLICGVPVTGLVSAGGKVAGIRWHGGLLEADRVLLATGVASQNLLAEVDVRLPMLKRPGLICRTAQLPPLLSHILVTPGQELRQQPDGRILAPTAASHQGDRAEKISENPAHLAAAAAARVSALLKQQVDWHEVTLAERPVPGDGLPVMGSCGLEGLYVSTMHSGATLAPLAAELMAGEIMDKGLSNTQAALIAPYRLQRFTT